MGNNFKNVPLKLFRQFLRSKGLKILRTNGRHEIWGRKPLLWPIVLQSHIDPIPEFIVKNNLRNMGATLEEFIEFCNS
jgi:hypothetical protein